MPSFSGGDDFVGVGFPFEGGGVLVVFGDEAVDGGLKVRNGVEYTSLESSPGELCEEPLDGVEPRGRGGCEVEGPAGVARQPGADLCMLVGRWSMVDIYVVTILVALVKLGNLATIEAGAGAVFFGAVVVITIIAAEGFDPRLIWDAMEDRDE